jgi:hypothetical protein
MFPERVKDWGRAAFAMRFFSEFLQAVAKLCRRYVRTSKEDPGRLLFYRGPF